MIEQHEAIGERLHLAHEWHPAPWHTADAGRACAPTAAGRADQPLRRGKPFQPCKSRAASAAFRHRAFRCGERSAVPLLQEQANETHDPGRHGGTTDDHSAHAENYHVLHSSPNSPWYVYEIARNAHGEPMCGLTAPFTFGNNSKSLGYFYLKASPNRMVVEIGKNTWKMVPDKSVPLTITFDDRNSDPWNATAVTYAGSDGQTRTMTIDLDDLAARFLEAFRTADKMVVTFKHGNEPVWTANMNGTRKAVEVFMKCASNIADEQTTQPDTDDAPASSEAPARPNIYGTPPKYRRLPRCALNPFPRQRGDVSPLRLTPAAARRASRRTSKQEQTMKRSIFAAAAVLLISTAAAQALELNCSVPRVALGDEPDNNPVVAVEIIYKAENHAWRIFHHLRNGWWSRATSNTPFRIGPITARPNGRVHSTATAIW
jgi:hypothetical protein